MRNGPATRQSKSRRPARRRKESRVHLQLTVREAFYHSGVGQQVIPINAVDPDQPGRGQWLVAWVLCNAFSKPDAWAWRIVLAVNRSKK